MARMGNLVERIQNEMCRTIVRILRIAKII
jgi:hypothetical protein